MSATDLALATAVLAVGGTVQGSVGFGSLVVGAPLLVLIEPDLVPGPALLAAFALVVLIAYRDRAGIHVAGVGWMIVGRVPGTVLGGLAVAGLPERSLELVFGALLLLAVAMSASGLHLAPERPALLAAGALSGFMGTTTSVGGPPLALVYQRESGTTIRGTLNAMFVIGSLLSIVTLAAFGEFGRRELGAGLALVPGIVAGFLVSNRTAPRLDQGVIRAAVLIVAGGSALAVLARALV